MLLDRRPKPRSGFSLSDVPRKAWLVAAAPVLVLVAFLALSRPFGVKARMTSLEQQAAAIEKASGAEGDLTRYPVGSVCSGTFSDAMKNQLTASIMNTGLKVAAFEVSQKGEEGLSHPLMAYTVTLKGSGTYEQAVDALEALARARPKLFLEAMTLRNQTSSVDLDLEGRFYCK